MLAVGTDLVEVERIERMLREHGERFLSRVFTAQERADAGEGERRATHLAARFAAKEAAMKALGTGLSGGITWHDIETVRTPTGAPEVRLHGVAASIARERGLLAWAVSLSHTRSLASAVVIASSGKGD